MVKKEQIFLQYIKSEFRNRILFILIRLLYQKTIIKYSIKNDKNDTPEAYSLIKNKQVMMILMDFDCH